MKHWTDYWNNTESLNSFAEGQASSGYSGEIKGFWVRHFSQIEAGSTLVDVGTGNGALAVLAQEYSSSKNCLWQVHGLDPANINPLSLYKDDEAIQKSLQAITFHSNLKIENHQFSSKSIDAFISQFAFEYSDMATSLDACYEALKPNGTITLIAHHQDSTITQDSVIGFEVLDFCLKNTTVFPQALTLLLTAEKHLKNKSLEKWNNNKDKKRLTANIHRIIQELQERFANEQERFWLMDIIQRIVKRLSAIGSVPTNILLKDFKLMQTQLNNHRLRLREQNNVALNDEKLLEISKHANLLNCSCEYQALHLDSNIFAWTISIRKL